MRKSYVALAAASLVALTSLASTATAGSAADPEVTDTCDDGYVNVTGDSMVPPDAVNPLAAWFRGIWEPGEDEPIFKALEVTLQACADMDFIPPTPHQLAGVAYSVRWHVGDCVQSVRLIRSFDVPKRVDVRQTCGSGPVRLLTLPDAASKIEGDRLIVTLDVAAVSTVLQGLVDGRSLVLPRAASWWVLSTDGSGSGNSSIGIDESEDGRTFKIGQDKPEQP